MGTLLRRCAKTMRSFQITLGRTCYNLTENWFASYDVVNRILAPENLRNDLIDLQEVHDHAGKHVKQRASC